MRSATAAATLCLLADLAQAGELAPRSFASTALGEQIPAIIYTPDGQPPEEGWPVLYLLHGHDGSERSWADLGDIQATLDQLTSTGSIEPALVVMPGGGNSWYVDSADVAGPGDFATAIAHDLRLAVEAAYPVRSDRGGRAIAGLSMGGYGALRLALEHPEQYVAAASLSGAIWQNIPPEDFNATVEGIDIIQKTAYFHRIDPETVTAGRVLPSVASHFGGAFGVPFDPRRFNRMNVFTLLERQLETKAGLPAIYLTCGDDDRFDLWRGALALFETGRADGLEDMQLRITDGDHAWSVWSTSIVDALKFIDAHWQPMTE
nr:alpha/beta hydrolase family protein [Geminicoccus roseus]